MKGIEGFSEPHWICARRCYEAAEHFEGNTRKALRRAATRYLAGAFMVDDPRDYNGGGTVAGNDLDSHGDVSRLTQQRRETRPAGPKG